METQINLNLPNTIQLSPQMSADITELAKALAKAQGLIKGAEKDSENPYFKSNYADLASNIEATRKPFSDNGLSVTQTVHTVSNEYFVTTLILHSSGQFLTSGAMRLPSSIGNDPQKTLAALTYYRRGQFAALCRLAQVDDDGNSVSPNPQQRVQAQQAQKQATPPPKPQNFAPQTKEQAKSGLVLDPATQARVNKLANGG